MKLLGQFDVRRDGTSIAIASRLAQSLLAYLLLTAGIAHRREKLAGLLWPDSSEDNARSNLRHELWRLRKALEPPRTRARERAAPCLLVDELSIAFNADCKYWLDVHALEQPGAADVSADDLIGVLSLYRGELLPGLYDDWVVLERERLQALFEQKMAQLVERLQKEKYWHDVLEWGERWIALGQTPEPAYRALMTAHAALGNMAQVALVFERCVQALRQDLSVEPSEQTRRLFEQLSEGRQPPIASQRPSLSITTGAGAPQAASAAEVVVAPARADNLPSVAAISAPSPYLPPSRTTNLPIALTRFIGRARELSEVKRLCAAARLVTLTGAGGCGKTRLAIQVASDLLDRFQDGVRLIEFAALTDASLVAQTVAKTLDLEGSPRQPLREMLADHLRSKHTLLIFDNCEHLVTACAQLADSLLSTCPNLKILVTSREALGITGEVLYRVPSLSLPPISQSSSANTLAQYEAAQLFVDRAATLQPHFLLTNQNAPAVERICWRLDGIPLAIELAAARIRALTVEQIAAHLDDCLRLLTSGSRTAPPRQQTLRATMDWSYALLSEQEQTLLNRLSVFAGGWTLEAAEAVCSEQWTVNSKLATDHYPLSTALDTLSRLVDKSLVIVDEQGSVARYRMLETIREYAFQKLLDAEGIDLRRARHLEFFRQLAERSEPELRGADQKLWLDRLEVEHDNLRAALGWALREDAPQADAEAGLRLAVALAEFWQRRNYWKEGREWIERALNVTEGTPPTPYRAKAFMAAFDFAFDMGDMTVARSRLETAEALFRELDDARGIAESLLGHASLVQLQDADQVARRAYLQEGLQIFERIGDKRGTAEALSGLGHAMLSQGDLASARSYFTESLRLRHEIGDKNAIAASLMSLAYVNFSERAYAPARALMEEFLAFKKEQGSKSGIRHALVNLGEVTRAEGNYDQAAQYYEANLTLALKLPARFHVCCSQIGLAYVALHQGDPQRAREYLMPALAYYREQGVEPGVAFVTEALAMAAAAEGKPQKAARILGAIDSPLTFTGGGATPADRVEHERSLAALRAQLGDAAFDACRAEGQTMSFEQAVALALEH